MDPMPLLPALAPPLVGAFIGYMTNYVAIRMLFRPLKPWRILGLRLPMTPGVIPAKRHELAENIGEMVGGHLLTSRDVSQALTNPEFQDELRTLVETRVSDILQRDLGPVASLIPARFRSYFEVGITVIRLRFLEHLHAHLDGERLAEALTPAIEQQFNDLLASSPAGLLERATMEQLYSFMEETTARFLAGPEVQAWLADYINRQVDDFLERDGCLNDLLSPELGEALLDRLAEETPNLLQKLAALLEDPTVQRKIAGGLSQAVGSFASSMGPLVSMFAAFLNPQKIEEKVLEYLAGNSGAISQWLFDPQVQAKVTALLREKGAGILATPIRSWLNELPPERLAAARRAGIDLLLTALRKPEVARALSNLVRDGLELAYERPLAESLEQIFGKQGLARSGAWVSREIITIVRSGRVKRLLDKLVTDLIDQRLLKQPIGPLTSFLPPEVQAGIADYLLEQLSDILVREVPGLVDSLNIKKIVARKVDSLDLLRLEGLLLGIMQEQFKYINLFGALLGFIIGLANLLFLTLS